MDAKAWENVKIKISGVEKTVPDFLWDTSAKLADELHEYYKSKLGYHMVEGGTLVFNVERDGKPLAIGKLTYDMHSHKLTLAFKSEVSQIPEITSSMSTDEVNFGFDRIKFSLAMLLPEILESAGLQ